MLLVMSYNLQIVGAIILCVSLPLLVLLPLAPRRPSPPPEPTPDLSLTLLPSLSSCSGAFLGHFVFHRGIDLGAGAGEEDSKGLQCH